MKKTGFFLILLLSVLIFSCNQGSKTKQVDGILPKDKFVEVLKDCQLAEASIYMQKMKQPDITPYTKHLYKAIFEKHHITEAQFNTNIDYYKSRPDELLIIYSNLVDTLSKMQSTLISGKKQK